MKDDICLDCILKSQNTRSVPLWQKKEGQDSLLPKIIRDDLYNPRKNELKREHPKLTTNKTKLKPVLNSSNPRLPNSPNVRFSQPKSKKLEVLPIIIEV